jgi:hypothetical protein
MNIKQESLMPDFKDLLNDLAFVRQNNLEESIVSRIKIEHTCINISKKLIEIEDKVSRLEDRLGIEPFPF